jgi:hypothetical protein
MVGVTGSIPVAPTAFIALRCYAELVAASSSTAFAPKRTILTVAVRADRVGFLTALESEAHPPELGCSVTGRLLVWGDEEVETAAGHVGDLGGSPRAIIEFGSGGAAVDIGSDLRGVGTRTLALTNHLLNPRPGWRILP